MLEPSHNDELPAIPGKRYFTIGEVSELCGVSLGVVVGHADEHQDARPDLTGDLSSAGDALDRHLRPADPLHQSSHRSQPTLR